MKSRKNVILSSIILSLITLIGATFAWATWSLNKTAMVLTIGNIDAMRITIAPYVINTSLEPVHNYDDGTVIDVEVINNKGIPALFGVYFRINSIDSKLLDPSFKYYITMSEDGNNYDYYDDGDFSNSLDSNRFYIIEDSIDSGDAYYFKIYIYIDDNGENQVSMAGSSLDMELRGALEGKAVNYIDLLYNVDNQDQIYQVSHAAIAAVDSATGLDIAATTDYRYYGANPNNYICLDYEGNTTCPDKHLYRIIGLIYNEYMGVQQLKLIKANGISAYDNTDGEDVDTFYWDAYINISEYSSNSWTSASINDLLNNYYYYSDVNNNYYSTIQMDNIEISFEDTGLSESARNMISKATYYLGGTDSIDSTTTPDDFYSYERGNTIVTSPTDGRTRYNTWIGYLGILYPSDYGYANSTDCKINVSNNCGSNNWLSNVQQQTITPVTNTEDKTFFINNSNHNNVIISSSSNIMEYVVKPVMYLKDDVMITGGLGTSTYPYKLEKTAYKEEILNGSDPVLYDGLIPITFAGNTGATVKVANNSEKWYSYKEKKWANAVLVKDDATENCETCHSRSYYLEHPGATIDDNDILGYFVWIPRYSYKTWSLSASAYTTAHEIEINFIDTDTVETPSVAGDYYTHPSFKFGTTKLSGFWVGKFETSHVTLSSSTTADNLGCTNTTCANADGLRILANKKALNYNSVAKFFYATLSMQKDANPFGLSSTGIDIHMMKNSEWGAVAYLAYSQYGKNAELTINNQNYYTTGCGANTSNATSTSDCNNRYGTVSVYPQSTTGNVTGIFDMSGCSYEYVMGNYIDRVVYSGFSSMPNAKYYNRYSVTSLNTCSFSECGGHALNETYSWNGDGNIALTRDFAFILRGGRLDVGAEAGIFAYNRANGGNAYDRGYRIVIINN